MIPLLSTLVTAFTKACEAYVAWVEWSRTTHLESQLQALEDEKVRLADNPTPANELRLEVIAGRIKRLSEQPERPSRPTDGASN